MTGNVRRATGIIPPGEEKIFTLAVNPSEAELTLGAKVDLVAAVVKNEGDLEPFASAVLSVFVGFSEDVSTGNG